MSNSVRPHRWQPTRLPCPWDSPSKNTGVGCHFLLQCTKVKSESEVAQLCLTLCHTIDGLLLGSPIPGTLQARTPEWVPISLVREFIILMALSSNYDGCWDITSGRFYSGPFRNGDPFCPRSCWKQPTNALPLGSALHLTSQQGTPLRYSSCCSSYLLGGVQ